MESLTRNKQNEFAFFSIYNFLVLQEMNNTINPVQILESVCDKKYDEIDIFIKEVLLKCVSNYAILKKTIEEHLINWTYERVSLINKAILMFGLTNALFMKDLDKRLIIDISVSLAKKYGDNRDYGFINAILDKTI